VPGSLGNDPPGSDRGKGKHEASKNRQKALERARQEIEDARKALALAERNLERLGQKPQSDFKVALKRMH